MDWNTIQQAIVAFFASWQLRGILLLIVADVGFGISAALMHGEFNAEQTANFYRTQVAPYVLGYLTAYVCVKVILPGTPIPGIEQLPINEAAVTVAWMAILVTMGKSIVKNFMDLYTGFLDRQSKP